jgi:diketogulonate reductase-like aldo/keto reductase
MRTHELGNSGANLPVIGPGTWQYTGSVEPLGSGAEAGARFIDAGESQGSENDVGAAIRAIRKKSFSPKSGVCQKSIAEK